MIKKNFLQKVEIGDVFAYTLDNGKGLKAEILNLGGIVRRLEFAGVDVVLGRDDYQEYLYGKGYFGSIIGRNSNRIEGCKFKIGEKEYTLLKNESDKNNNLHGGKVGFNAKLWDVEEKDGDEPSLVLKTTSKDGEEGFPANVSVKVTYTVTSDNALRIHYEGESDGDTILNLTNHSYFNLNGHTSGDIKEHTLWLDSNFYTPMTENTVPDGRILSVFGTVFDFTVPKKIGQDIDKDDKQLKFGNGYDHNFAINGRGMRKFAVLTGDKTGIKMEAYTDLPAVQLYTGNWVGNTPDGKDGAVYKERQGVCLETQVFPNFTKFSHFPDGFLKKGQKYDTVTEYKFSK
ncbi:MAG: galactose mutarotase [Clostridia bacterium]|nr:galactose mutarotase [Clostridia bacterium]